MSRFCFKTGIVALWFLVISLYHTDVSAQCVPTDFTVEVSCLGDPTGLVIAGLEISSAHSMVFEVRDGLTLIEEFTLTGDSDLDGNFEGTTPIFPSNYAGFTLALIGVANTSTKPCTGTYTNEYTATIVFGEKPELVGTPATICIGEPVDIRNFFTDNANVAGINDIFSSLANAQNQTGSLPDWVVSPSSTTSYFVRKDATSSGCFDIIEVVVTVVSGPDLVAQDSTICAGIDIELLTLITDNNNIPGSFSVYGSQVDAENEQNPLPFTTVNPIVPTDYFLRKNGPSPVCFDIVEVSIDTIIGPDLVDINLNACNDVAVDLLEVVPDTSNISGTFINYATLLDAENQVNALPTNIVNPTTPISYFPRKNAFNSECFSIAEIAFVIITPDLSSFFSNICQGDFVELSDQIVDSNNVVGAYTAYLTQTDAENKTNPLPSTFLAPDTTTTFHVRKDGDSESCFDIVEVLVIVDPAPSLSAADQTICVGESINPLTFITDSSPLNGGFNIYGSLEDAENQENGLPSFDVSPTVTTTYFLRKDIFANDCFDIVPLVITVLDGPDLQVVDPSTCPGDTISLASAITDNNNITGSFTAYTSLTDAENETNPLPSIEVAPTITTTYFVRKNGPSPVCFDIVPVTVNILNGPLLVVAPDTICIGESVDLSTRFTDINNITGPVAYYSSQGDALAEINPFASPVVSPATTNTYFIRKNDSGGSCFNIAAISVTVVPGPALLATPATICVEESVDLSTLITDSNNITGTLTAYLTQLDAENETNALPGTLVSPSTSTNYFLRKNGPSVACFAILEVPVTVNPKPILLIQDPTICIGETINALSVTTDSLDLEGGLDIFPSLVDAQNQTNGLPSFDLSPTTTTTFYIRKNVLITECFDIEPLTITVLSGPDLVVEPLTICPGGSVDLLTRVSDNNNIIGTTDFYASQGDAENENNPLASSLVSPLTTTTYFIRKNGPSAACFAITSVLITVGEQPELVAIPDTICIGESVDLATRITDNGNVQGTLVAYTSSEDALAQQNPLPDLTVSPTLTSQYFVRKDDLGGNCFDIVSITISVDQGPELVAQNAVLCLGDSIGLDTLVSDNNNIQGNITAYLSLSDANSEVNALASSTVSPSDTTSYFLRKNGPSPLCFAIIEVSVAVNPVPDLRIQNVEICIGETINIVGLVGDSASVVGGLDIFGSLTDAQNQVNGLPSFDLSPTTTTTYYIRKDADASICFDIEPLTITVFPGPGLVVTNPGICPGSSTDLVNAVADTNNIQGSFTAYSNLVDAEAQQNALLSTVVSPAVNTTYFVRKNGPSEACFAIVPVQVTIGSGPILTAETDTICVGEPTDLTDLVTDSQNIEGSFKAYLSLADADSQINALDTTLVSPQSSTSYFMRKDDIGGTCFSIVEVPIVVLPGPDLVAQSAEICLGDSVDLASLIIDNNDIEGTYTAYLSEVDASLEQNALDSTLVAPDSSSTYFVRKNGPSIECFAIIALAVQVNPVPDLRIQDVGICIDETINIVGLVGDSANVVGGLDIFGSLVDAQNQVNGLPSFNLSPGTTTTYYVRKDADGSTCFDIEPLTITVFPGPGLVVTNPTICPGSSTDLIEAVVDTNNIQGIFTAYGSLADAESQQNALASTLVSPVADTPYFIRKDGPSEACFAIATVQVNIGTGPILTARADTICVGVFTNLLTLVADSGNIEGSFQAYLSFADADSQINALDTTLVSPQSSTSYFLRKDDNGGSCFSIVEVPVLVLPGPDLIAQPATICLGDSIDLASLIVDNNNIEGTYAAYLSQEDASLQQNALDSTWVSPDSSLTYFVRKNGPSEACFAIIDININVNPVPDLWAQAITICIGETINVLPFVVDSANVQGGTDIFPSFLDAQNQTNGLPSFEVSPDTTTTYYLRKDVDNNPCFDIVAVTVTVVNGPALVVQNPTICPGTTIDLVASITDLNNILGAFTAYSSLAHAEAELNPLPSTLVVPLSDTTYFVRKNGPSEACFAIVPVSVTISDGPQLFAQTDTLCIGEQIDLQTLVSDSSNILGVFTAYLSLADADSQVNALDTTVVSPEISTNYFLRKDDVGGNCFSIVEVPIVLVDGPDLVATPAENCLGDSLNLVDLIVDNNNIEGTYTAYLRQDDAVLEQNPLDTIWVSPDSSLSYFVRKNGPSESCFAIVEVPITVNPVPDLRAQTATICIGETINVLTFVVDSANVLGGTDIFPTLLDAQNQSNGLPSFDVSPDTTTTYYIRKDAQGNPCFDIVPVIVTVVNGPELVVLNPTVCTGSTINLVESITDLNNIVGQYTAYTSQADAENEVDPLTSTLVEPLVDTTYFIRKNGPSETCFAIVPLSITISTGPQLFAQSDTICIGETLNLQTLVTDSSSLAGTFQAYLSLADADSQLNALDSLIVSPTQSTNYFLRKDDNSGTCFSIIELPVVVVDGPDLLAEPVSLCEGDLVDLKNLITDRNGIVGNLSAYTSRGDADNQVNVLPSLLVSPTQSTSYYVRKNGPSEACFGIVEVRVTVNNKPQLIALSSSLCQGESVNILGLVTDAADVNGQSNIYATLQDAQNEENSLASFEVAPIATTSYFIRKNSLQNTSCFDIAEVIVAINPIPRLEVRDTVLCAGESVDVSLLTNDLNNVSGPEVVYLTNLDAINQVNPLPSLLVSPATTTTYFIRKNATNEACFDIATINVTVNTMPLASILSTTDPSCENASGSVTLGASGGEAPYTFSQDGTNFSNQSNFTSLSAGSYIFYVQDAIGCEDTVGFSLFNADGPSASITERMDITCKGDSTGVISLETQGGVSPYQYSLNNGPFGNGNTFDSLLAGTYVITINDASGCSFVVNTEITEPEFPLSVTIFTSGALDCSSNGGLFVQAFGGTPPYLYSIDGGQSTQTTARFTNLIPGTYPVQVIDADQCVFEMETIVETECCPEFSLVEADKDFICYGDTLTLFARITTEDGGQLTWFEILDDSTQVPIANPSAITFPGEGCGVNIHRYQARYIPSQENCDTIFSDFVVVEEYPTIKANILAISECEARVVDLDSCANYLVTWSDNLGRSGNSTIYTAFSGSSGTVNFIITNLDVPPGTPCSEKIISWDFSCLSQNCSVDSVAVGFQEPCNSSNNQYSQIITVYHELNPGSGTLNINNQSFAIDPSPQTVILEGLIADGNSVDIDVRFSADTTCRFFVPNAFVAPTPCGPFSCSLASIAGENFAIRLDSLPGISDGRHTFMSDGMLTIQPSGLASITGTIRHITDTSIQWYVDLQLVDGEGWTTWNLKNRTYRANPATADIGTATANHEDWRFWVLDPTNSRITSMTGPFDGVALGLQHTPSDFRLGFQFGVGANDYTADLGVSGDFSWVGIFGGIAASGAGTVNGTLNCGGPNPDMIPLSLIEDITISNEVILAPFVSELVLDINADLEMSLELIDREGPVSFRLEGAPEGMLNVISGVGRSVGLKLFWTVDDDDVGIYPIKLYSIDESGQERLRTFTINVVGEGTGGTALVVCDVIKIGPNDVEVVWETSFELTGTRFQVERSSDGEIFQNLGEVAGRGNATESFEAYNFIDLDVPGEIAFYRLKIIAPDGSFAFGEVKVVRFDEELPLEIRIFPNPTSDILNVRVPINVEGRYEFAIIDERGRKVAGRAEFLTVGLYATDFDLSRLREGPYLIYMFGENFSAAKRFVKLK